MDQNKALKKFGLKVTHPRLVILAILQDRIQQHLCAEEIYKIILDNNDDIGMATVYRVLNQFEDAGLVERHHFDGGKSVFELCDKKHHDHLVCLKCEKIVEFQDEVIEGRQKQIASQYNMQLTNHSLYLYGECINGCDD